jgi:hypothetical protein
LKNKVDSQDKQAKGANRAGSRQEQCDIVAHKIKPQLSGLGVDLHCNAKTQLTLNWRNIARSLSDYRLAHTTVTRNVGELGLLPHRAPFEMGTKG